MIPFTRKLKFQEEMSVEVLEISIMQEKKLHFRKKNCLCGNCWSVTDSKSFHKDFVRP